jgi:hypothetical protein
MVNVVKDLRVGFLSSFLLGLCGGSVNLAVDVVGVAEKL